MIIKGGGRVGGWVSLFERVVRVSLFKCWGVGLAYEKVFIRVIDQFFRHAVGAHAAVGLARVADCVTTFPHQKRPP